MTAQVQSSFAVKLAKLAPLLEYPFGNFPELLQEALSAVPDAKQSLSEFKSKVGSLQQEELEELYSRTFDLAPICVPYISSYIYGDENFERGKFMTALSERYSESGFEIMGELPDHASVILKFAPQMAADELAEMIEFCLLNGVEKMMDSLKEADNPYFYLLKSVKDVIESSNRGKLL